MAIEAPCHAIFVWKPKIMDSMFFLLCLGFYLVRIKALSVTRFTQLTTYRLQTNNWRFTNYLCSGFFLNLICGNPPMVVVRTHSNGKPLAFLSSKVGRGGYKPWVRVHLEKATIISGWYSVLHWAEVTSVSIYSLRHKVEPSLWLLLIREYKLKFSLDKMIE